MISVAYWELGTEHLISSFELLGKFCVKGSKRHGEPAMKFLVYIVAFLFCITSTAYAQPKAVVDQSQAVHLLNRVTFGPTAGDIDRVKAMGLQTFIEEQLNPRSLPESPVVQNLEANSTTNRKSNEELIGEFRSLQQRIQQAKKADGDGANAGNNENLKQMVGRYKELRQQDIATKLGRCIESPRQLQEVMTEFWFNHFNVFLNKGLDTILVDSYENQAIRPNALGNFRDLVEATCHHPAMLFYLDNWENTAPDSPGSKGRFKGLNENYARELMELHTLGVDGGYTQKDVTELARVLTGLSIAQPQQLQQARLGRVQLQPVGNYGAYFYPQRHDFGQKVVLGRRINGSGENEIEECIDMLVRNPATAHHISYQLAQYFVCDNPPDTLVNRLSARFTQSNGDIKTVLRELFYSKEFWDPKYENAKYKTPLRYVVSTLRASGTHLQNYGPVDQFLRLQGEPLYGCVTPDGYKNTKEAWLNPDGLIRRINFATAVAAGKLPGASEQPPEYRQLGATISGSKFSTHTVAVVAKAPDAMKSAVVLGSPEFMHY
jgi:uncharacterized protein (DUF1800 family)